MSLYMKIGIVSLNAFAAGVIVGMIWFVCELVSLLSSL